jgi:RNA polymerase sigma factor (sigma-70 family)
MILIFNLQQSINTTQRSYKISPTEINITEMFDRIDYHTAIAIKRHLVHPQELDDLQQDIILAIFIRAKGFDPFQSAWSTFLNMIIESEIKHFRLRKRWRKYQAFVCVDDLEEDEHPLTNFYPTSELNELERHVFFGEIRHVIDVLPPELRKICQLLWICSKVKIAARLKMETGTLSKQIEKIRFLLNESKVIQDFFEKNY